MCVHPRRIQPLCFEERGRLVDEVACLQGISTVQMVSRQSQLGVRIRGVHLNGALVAPLGAAEKALLVGLESLDHQPK